MKAVFGDVEEVAFSMGRAMVLNNTFLQFDSGGIPEKIQNLTYKEVIHYYKRFYCPENMCIVLHGCTKYDLV